MSNYVFEVAKVRQANQNIWLVGGRALEDIEVGDLVQVDGSPEQKDASQASTATHLRRDTSLLVIPRCAKNLMLAGRRFFAQRGMTRKRMAKVSRLKWMA